MKLNNIILAGFLIIIVLVVVLAGVNNYLNNDRLSKTNQIKDVESPLEIMSEQVISYDAMLTGAAREALLDAQKGNIEGVRERKAYYDDIGTKLDNLLKFQARALLEKSQRSQEVKDDVSNILKELDKVNLELVDLEVGAFLAMEKNDTEKAYSLIIGEPYPTYKKQLAELYQNWSDIEYGTTTDVRGQIIQESIQLNAINLYSSIVIIVLALIISFLVSIFISNAIRKLTDNVEEITKGNVEIQLSKSRISEIQGLTDSLNRILASLKLAILRVGASKGELGLGEAIRAKEEAEERYKLLYETSADAIMTIEPPSWKFTAGNPATLKMFGLKDEKELQGFDPWDLSPEKQPNGKSSVVAAKKMIMKAMKQGSAFFEWTYRKYKGESFPATILLTRFKLNGKDVVQATVRNISLQRLVEAELKRTEAKKNIEIGREQITAEREHTAKGREQIVGKREGVVKGREQIVGKREKIKPGQGREGIALGRENVVGKREEVAKGRENVVRKREDIATRREEIGRTKKKKVTGREFAVKGREYVAAERESKVARREKKETKRENKVGFK